MEADPTTIEDCYTLAEAARGAVLTYVDRYKPTYYKQLQDIDIKMLVKFIDESDWANVWSAVSTSGNPALAEAVTSSKRPVAPSDGKAPVASKKPPPGKPNMMALLKQAQREKKEQLITPALEAPMDRTIYVRRSYHTKGTLIHEMLHWLTHKDFEIRFTLNPALGHFAGYRDSLIEGTTEHITRKILKVKNARTDVRGQHNFYGPEYAKMQAISKALKKNVKQSSNTNTDSQAEGDVALEATVKNVLAKAYFQGDQLALQGVERMFAELTK